MNHPTIEQIPLKHTMAVAALSATLMWLSQPPVAIWLLGFIVLVPWIVLIESTRRIGKSGYSVIWAFSSIYFLLSLQGLRHAHPAMAIPWLALGCYLAVYHVAFVAACRQLRATGIPLWIVVPLTWGSLEVIRSYLLTGISALMLGHVFADVPEMIQIADLFGSYGVGVVAAMVNVTVWALALLVLRKRPIRRMLPSIVVAVVALTVTIGYGHYRLGQPRVETLATFALIQRDEPVEYGQSLEREVEMFQAYARQSIEVARDAKEPIDAFVWPESMYTGGSPWMAIGDSFVVPEQAAMSEAEFRQWVDQRQDEFQQRSRYVVDALGLELPNKKAPQLIVGCGVVTYDAMPQVYSGVVRVQANAERPDWYGKTHLVMFGEYIPIAPWVPGLRSLIPPGMGLQVGPGAQRFQVGETTVSPSICIETAVERVTLRQMRELASEGLPDVVVTVTNDGWFDDSSVIEHHLRCAQLVAVATRRPILSAANNGPTAWIDSCGRVIQRLGTGAEGAIIAKPLRDLRESFAVRWGDWPAWGAVFAFCGLLLYSRRSRQDTPTDRIEAVSDEAGGENETDD
jgi:apolipoprotein N-acyltransferase